MQCLDTIVRRKGMAKDLTQYEEAAIKEAGFQAGDYIQSVGKTDLALYSESEWLAFLRVIYLGATGEVRKRTSLITDDDIPF